MDFGNDPIKHLFFKLYWPTLTGMLTMAAYQVADGIIVGYGVGTMGLAGISMSFPVLMVAISLAMLFGIGSSMVVAIKLGENQPTEANRVFHYGCSFSVLISTAFTGVLLIWMDMWVDLLGANADIQPYLREYLIYWAIFLPTLFLRFSFSFFINNDKSPHVSRNANILSSILNVLLDLLFVLVFEWELKGAAIATGIAQTVAVIYMGYHFYLGKQQLSFTSYKFKVRDHEQKRILKLGFPIFIAEISGALAFALLNRVAISQGGSEAGAALATISFTLFFVMKFLVGVAFSVQPVFGFNHGAKNHQRIEELLGFSLKFVFVIGGLAYIFIYLFAGEIVSLFNVVNPEEVALATQALALFYPATAFMGANLVLGSYFQSVEKVKIATNLALLRGIVFVSLFLMLLPTAFGLTGVWLAIPLAEFVTFVVTLPFISLKKTAQYA
ncbi:MATE family efflux transporter [Photobacterium atrarenae]|uniref:Multidrug resistance protein NorM n=1 Tax=Photobacterium atrarenae TaxID=865757 RepID=A0ABY5GNK4_9GAMM|nr:MATE family efflux transporter [Photobacterium atrarenae]UTV30341.1 MATE family efflux transporter [Photobacterium atrarenae]